MKTLNRIAYACQMPVDGTNLHGEKIATVPTFPYDPKSKSSSRTASHWAQKGWGDAIGQAPIMEFDNKPFSLKLLRLERRLKGGRAYKVIDDRCRVFDLREDQFVDAIRAGGIDTQGLFGAPFVWAQSGNGVKLIAVGGEYHSKLVNADDIAREQRERLRERAPLTGRDLVPGATYHDGKGEKFAYLGCCTCPATGKRRYAIIPLYKYHDDPRLSYRIELRSGIRASERVEPDWDLASLRQNTANRDYGPADSGSYVDKWTGGPPVRDIGDIYQDDFNGYNRSPFPTHHYNTPEWKKATQIHNDMVDVRRRAFRDALVWHD